MGVRFYSRLDLAGHQQLCPVDLYWTGGWKLISRNGSQTLSIVLRTYRDDWNLGKKSIITQEASKRFFQQHSISVPFPSISNCKEFSFPTPGRNRTIKRKKNALLQLHRESPPPFPHPSIALAYTTTPVWVGKKGVGGGHCRW